MKKVILIGALSLLCGAGANATINIAGVAKQVDTLECRSVGPGVQYVRMHMPEYPLDVYTLTIDLNNPYNDVNTFIGKDHAGTTEAMTQAYTRLSTPGHRTIGSVNGNFWIVSGQGMDDLLGQPHSGCMVNGEFATEPNNWNRANRGEGIERLQEIAFVMLDEEKKMWIDDIYFEARVTNAANESFAIAEINRIRNENEIVLYNHFTGETESYIDGVDVIVEPVEGETWGSNKEVKCVVTRIVPGTGGTQLEGAEYALSGAGTGADFLNKLQVGDQVTISTSIKTRTDSLVPMARQMLTGNALVMREGQLTPRNENETYNSQTYSRTGIGMSQDGKTLYLIVIDYKSSTSVGCNTATMCYILKQAGAWNVANMDAGGSAQMMLRGSLVNNPADGKERPVSNGFMIFTNAPDDENLTHLAFDHYNLEIPAYACFEPTILGYNQYGVLVDTQVADYTLSCDPSLGTVSDDGKRFYAAPQATTGILHVTSGNATGEIKVTVKATEIAMKNSAVLADKAHPYPIEVISTIGENTYTYDPASLTWNIDDPTVCQIEGGVLTGLQNGQTRITGSIGDFSGTMDVTVEIPQSPRIPADDFTGWTTKAISAITDATVTPAGNGAGTLAFTYKSGRQPYVEMDKSVTLYSIPDTIRLLIHSEIPLSKVQIACKANGDKEQYLEYEGLETNSDYLIAIPSVQITGENNRGGFPITLNYIKFYINTSGTTSGQAYKIDLKEFSLVYNGVVSGIEAIAGDRNLTLYPNPVTDGTFCLEGEAIAPGSLVRIYDRNGALVLEQTIDRPGTIDAGSLPPDVYIVAVQTPHGNFVNKIVVQ